MKRHITLVTCFAALVLNCPASGLVQEEAELLLKAAIHKELVAGDLEGAISLYQEIIQKYPGQRAVAAEALVKMGLCYDNLGRQGAKDAFERVLREYADQLEQAKLARTQLERINQNSIQQPEGPTVRRLWVIRDSSLTPDFSGTPSPDGRYFSFVEWATGDVAVYDLNSEKYQFLTNHNSIRPPFLNRPSSASKMRGESHSTVFSPDGSEVAYSFYNYLENRWEVRVVPLQTDDRVQPKVIYQSDTIGFIYVNSWSPDGKLILVTIGHRDGSYELSFLRVSTGQLTVLKRFDWGHVHARLSPDGKTVAYQFAPEKANKANNIYVVTSDGRREATLVDHPADDRLIGWTPKGDEILFDSDRGGSRGLWTKPFELGSNAPARLVKAEIGNMRAVGITPDGSILYQNQKGFRDIFMVDLDPETGKVLNSPNRISSVSEGRNRGVACSPDGRYLAYVRLEGRSFQGTLVIYSLSDGKETEVDTSPVGVAFPRLRWSPDSNSVLCAGFYPSRGSGLYSVDIQSGVISLVREREIEETILYPVGWSSNPREVYFVSLRKSGVLVMLHNLDTGQDKVVLKLPDNWKGHSLSPDAQRLAVWDWVGNDWVLKVIALPDGEPRAVAKLNGSSGGFAGSTWSPDGRYIYFKSTKGEEKFEEIWRVSVQGGEPTRTGISFQRFDGFSVHPNGRQLAFSGSELEDELWVMENFLIEK